MKRLVACVSAAGVLWAALLLIGCQSVPPAPPVPEQVQVGIYYGVGPEVESEFVTITGRPTVLQVTRRVTPVATEITSTGEEWVVGIGGHLADVNERTMWMYELNSEAPTIPPNLQHVKPGDVVFWHLK